MEIFWTTLFLSFAIKQTASSLSLKAPHFSGDSFIKYPAPADIGEYLELNLKIKPSDKFGLIFFAGNSELEQYAALFLNHGYVCLQFDLGNGASLLRSESKVSLGEWHHLEAWRSGRGGLLKVSNQSWVEGVAPGGFSHVPPTNHVYVGGATEDVVPKSVLTASRTGFHGCLGEISVNERRFSPKLAESVMNVRECDANPCIPNPCSPGNCSLYHDEYICLCPYPYSGDHCQKKLGANSGTISFNGKGYLKFTQSEVMKHITGDILDLSVKFRLNNSGNTGQEKQILVFAGKETKGGDFLEVSVTPLGHVTATVELGSGPVTITHQRANARDNQWHTLTVKRIGRKFTVLFDGHVPETTVTPDGSIQLNVYEALYIGGYFPGRGQFSSYGFRGCITEVLLGKNFRIDRAQQASSAVNVEKCLDRL